MCGGLETCSSASNVSKSPEQRLADILFHEGGAHINPSVLRLIIKYRWDEVAKAAHEIHGSAR